MKDERHAPFCFRTLAATQAIRERFEGRQLAVALAVYATFTYVANEQRRRDGFRASRQQLARLAGTSDRMAPWCRAQRARASAVSRKSR